MNYVRCLHTAGGRFALSLILASLLGLVGASSAFAGHTTCRSDPQVTLSNGVVFNLAVTISDTATDVRQVTYALHGPVGTSVTNIVYTGYSFAGKETFTYTADEPAYTYRSGIVVTTGIRSPVTGVTTMTNAGSTVTASASVGGYSGQNLGSQIYYRG